MWASLRIARKDARDLFRERTIVLALLLQLFVAAFSSFLLVGLVSLYDPQKAESSVRSRLAYVGPGDFAEFLQNNSGLRVVVVDRAQALSLFDEGRVAAIIEEVASDPAGVHTINLLLGEGELTTTLLISLLKDQLKDYERQLRDEREAEIQTTVVHVEPPAGPRTYFGFAFSLLVPLLLIVPAFVSGAVAADSATQEVETRSLELLRVSPVSTGQLFAGKLVTPVLLAPLQGLLWILLLRANGIHVQNVATLLLLVAGLTLLLASLSVTIGFALRKQGDAQVAYSLFILLLFGATYLLPQPLLTTFARLAAGSATTVELGSVAAWVAASVTVAILGSAALRRVLAKIA